MKNIETLLSEISDMRKKMGLPIQGNYTNFLIEEKSPKLILEAAEYGIVKLVLKKVFPALLKYEDEAIEKVLAKNPVDVTINGVAYKLGSIADISEMVNAVKRIEANSNLTTENILDDIFSQKTNKQVTDFKGNVSDNINWMSLKSTREKHAAAKNKYTAKTSVDPLNNTPKISATESKVGSKNFAKIDIDISPVEAVFDDLEKNYLGKTSSTRDITNVDSEFSDGFSDLNIKTKTDDELDNIATTLEKQKTSFEEKINSLKKKITEEKEAGRINDAQVTTLNKQLDGILNDGKTMLDNTINYYKEAAENKRNVKETIELTEKKQRSIFDLEKEDVDFVGKPGESYDYRIGSDGKYYKKQKGSDSWQEMTDATEINTFRTNYSNEIEKSAKLQRNSEINDMLTEADNGLLGERNWWVRWFRTNKFFGGSGTGWWSRNMKMPVDNIVTFISNNKRLFQRDENGTFYWLSEVASESSGRYSYSDIKLRMQYIVNEMQNVINESLTNVEGKTFKDASMVEQRLKDLMKEMRDISSLQKFAGNIDAIKDPTTGKIDMSKVNDNTRIIEFMGDVKFQELKNIADDIKKTIDRAASENVEGAAELKTFWESKVAGDKTNIDVMTDFFSGLDEASKAQKTPISWISKEIYLDFLPFLKWFQGDNWTSAFKDADALAQGSWLYNGKLSFIGGTLNKIPVVGDFIKGSTGYVIAFFKTANEMIFRDFIFGALWNQFKYGRLSSIDDLNKMMTKYGPLKSGIVLVIRETVLAATVMAVAATLTEIVRFIDKGIGLFTKATDDLPVEEKLAWGITLLGNYVGSDGLEISAERLKEYLKMDFMDRVATFFSSPFNLKRLLPVGMAGDLMNLLTLGAVEGDNAEYFRIAHDYGWFNSQFDEAILDTGQLISDIITGNVRDPEAAEEQLNSELDMAKEKLHKWETTGIYYGQEKLKEINTTEQTVREGIEKNSQYENFPSSFVSDQNLMKKVLTLITLEHEPDFFKQTDDKTEGLRLWKNWYSEHKNNVGITDNGKFWQIKKGIGIGDPAYFFSLEKDGKLIPNKYGPGLESYYIYNPDEGKWYDLQYLDRFFPKEKIEEIWNKYNEEYQIKYTENMVNDHNKYYDARLKELDERIKSLEEIRDQYKSNGDDKTYPETFEKIEKRLNGGVFTYTYMNNDGKYVTKEQNFGVGLYGAKKELIEKHNKFIEDAKKQLQNITNENYIIKKIMKEIKNYIFESERFDEDDYKHWKDTFEFETEDEKNPGRYKKVKINMEDVMDRINHYRKKYDEDDAFVRAVIDTHENIVRFKFTKDLANINESYSPVGFGKILQQIREDRGELEIWSVSRPASGNWFLVKGDFTQKELAGMDLEKKEPRDKKPKKRENPLHDLKKKEHTSSENLKNDEKQGFDELPKIVKRKLKEKFNNGWSTEEPVDSLKSFYSESLVNSVFGDDIKIYKPRINNEFFNKLNDIKSNINLKKGFCRSLKLFRNHDELSMGNQKFLKRILNNCNNKFEGKLGITRVGS